MRIRFYHARILTMEEPLTIIEGEIWIKDEKIVYVGSLEEDLKLSEMIEWDREIDVCGNLLMPGFKNAHTHSGMTFLRSFADDFPLKEWLEEKVFPAEALLSEEDIYQCARLAILEYLTSGITAAADMYLAPDAMAKAAKETGFKTVLIGAVNDFTHSVNQMEEWYQNYRDAEELVQFQLGFHAEYTTSEEILKEIAILADEYHAPVFTHNAETENEVETCVAKTGCTPLAYLVKLGLFKHGGGIYHGVYLSEEDRRLCKEKNIAVIVNAASNLKLASGIIPVRMLLKDGLTLAIGTDGAASNNCLDMFREMFLVSGLGKAVSKDAAAVGAKDVLRMATVNGAKVLRLFDSDVLAAGKDADLIMLDLHQPNMQPLNDIIKNIVYSGSKQNVKMTMIRGKILYEDGKFFVGEEPEKIYNMVNQVVTRIKRDLEEKTE